MDTAKFHHITMGKKKDQLQSDVLSLGKHAYLLALDFATVDEHGNLLPSDQQPDENIREIFKIVGL